MKYGGVPEDEALKMITLNPAWQLGIDKRVGSIEVGKDADLAIFSAHPFAPDARVRDDAGGRDRLLRPREGPGGAGAARDRRREVRSEARSRLVGLRPCWPRRAAWRAADAAPGRHRGRADRDRRPGR